MVSYGIKRGLPSGKVSAAKRVAGFASKVGSRVVGRALTRGVSKMIPYAGAAMTAYDIGKAGYQMFASKRKKPAGMNTRGNFQGKFKKRKRPKSNLSVYANKGISSTYEVHGTVADPDCVYISHTTCDSFQLLAQAGRALFRKLFEKANFVISSIDELLISTSITTAVDWRVEITKVHGVTGVETVDTFHNLIATSTIRSVADAFSTVFLKYSAGETMTFAGNAVVDEFNLHRVILYRQDYNGTRSNVFEAELKFEDEILCVVGSSELKVQNRTKSASGSTDSTDINNNPLVGRSYLFNGMPKLKNKAAFALQSIPVDKGVQLVRAASISDTAFKEPPLPNTFSNCKSVAKVRLDPGAVKTSYVKCKKHMRFLPFLRQLRIQYGGATGFLSYYSIFPIEMFAFEDVINVNASENINVAYESNMVINCYFKTNRRARAVQCFQQDTKDNIPA